MTKKQNTTKSVINMRCIPGVLPNNPVAGAGVEPKRPPAAGAGAVICKVS